MLKLYLITEIDKNDEVKRSYVTAPSRRAPIFKNPQIVKSEEIEIPLADIEKALKAGKIQPHIIKHVITVLTPSK